MITTLNMVMLMDPFPVPAAHPARVAVGARMNAPAAPPHLLRL